MSEPEAASTQADLDALKALEADASELGRIEDLLDRFNVFETIGFVGQELMHSRFLAFLLDPRQKHGLGDDFLKRVLQEALASADKTSLVDLREDLDAMDLRDTLVRREHRFIDVLLTNEDHKLAVIVENKVWTTEHSNQLERYYRIVEDSHPGWRVLGVYLTPFGSLPSREEDRRRYATLGYAAVCEIVDGVLEDRGFDLSPDVRVAMEHYSGMVRRRIVDDPEVTRLCRSIYSKHKKALDLIYQKRPNHQALNRAILTNLVGNREGLISTGQSAVYVWFHPQSWEVPALDVTDDPGGILRFVFHNDPDGLDLFLETSPGDEATRRRLYEMGLNNRSVFNRVEDPDTDGWPKLYHRAFLSPGFPEDALDSEREQEIRRQWNRFLDNDLPQIEEALRREAWIWEYTDPDEARSGQDGRFVWGEGDIEITKRPENED